ncbi:hypothetical protein [Streptomyces sp. enrichment culture]|uniref:hypothetical protein n=1 Tax=Streptomyces sp. enrichment culture TaxID=1795815 RepID=UPI003F554930
MAKIHAPETDYNGTGPGGIEFRNGVAETDNASIIAWARARGYGIDGPAKQTATEPPEPADPRDVEAVRLGTPMRDAAVDPRPGDYLPPTNAGEANPHGPAVVSPEVGAAADRTGTRKTTAPRRKTSKEG